MVIKNKEKTQTPSMPKQEEVGYHKGAITTLVNERNELLKIAQIVESLIQVHMKRLEELGVKVNRQK